MQKQPKNTKAKCCIKLKGRTWVVSNIILFSHQRIFVDVLEIGFELLRAQS